MRIAAAFVALFFISLSGLSAQVNPNLNIRITPAPQNIEAPETKITTTAVVAVPDDFTRALEISKEMNIPLGTVLTDLVTKSSTSDIKSGLAKDPGHDFKALKTEAIGERRTGTETPAGFAANSRSAPFSSLARTSYLDPNLILTKPNLTTTISKGYLPRTIELDSRFESNVARLASYTEPQNIRNSRVWGGVAIREDQDAFRDVVAIVGNNRICSGTLVGSDLVLTAAHCYCGGVIEEAVIGTNILTPAERIKIDKARSAAFVSCTQLSSDISVGDVALLRLSTPATMSGRRIAGLKMVRDSAAVRAVGFGQTERNILGFKYQVNIVIASYQCDGPGVQGTSDSDVYRCRASHELVAAGLNRDTCGGDSGGPVFVLGPDARLYVAGVTSRAVDPNGLCGPGGIYVLLSAPPIRAWLEAQGLTISD